MEKERLPDLVTSDNLVTLERSVEEFMASIKQQQVLNNIVSWNRKFNFFSHLKIGFCNCCSHSFSIQKPPGEMSLLNQEEQTEVAEQVRNNQYINKMKGE